MKKALGETQTLRAGRSNAEPKIFTPPQTPPGGAGSPKFNQLEMVTTCTYRQFGEDRCTQFRVIVVTDTARPLHTHRQDRLQYTAPQIARCKNRSERRKHCAVAVVRLSQKKFCPAADHRFGGAGRRKFNQLETVTTFTYKPSLVRNEACNFELSW